MILEDEGLGGRVVGNKIPIDFLQVIAHSSSLSIGDEVANLLSTQDSIIWVLLDASIHKIGVQFPEALQVGPMGHVLHRHVQAV